ncbi:hypothetical protein LPB140_03755 [Sphingorhabdus lutea]|uniref:Uncharacterized protein n=1 Tax=Sphingorhabdus lutea TaxID=1913578 RepID=A0A1L3JEJ4_9SPHN|nr:hypothetical protein LPB140_03755 [Sphingorhabdus lutea]
MKISSLALALSVPILSAQPAFANGDKKAELARPAIFDDLVSCRDITDAAQRLACYDEKVGALDAAEKNNDIILTDKASVQEAKKGLFGLSLPSIKIFDKDDTEINEISGVVASAYQRNYRWTIILEDGAKWVQTETSSIVRSPKKGMPVEIRKASLGSFLVNIDGQRAIKMRREN